MEFLQNIDVTVFYFINNTLANPVTDSFMKFITESKNWIIFYVIIWFYMVIKGGGKGIVAGILILICILCSDQLSNLLKDLFQRIRPCNVLPHVNLLAGCTDSYAFPSSHAVNNYAAATLFSYFYPNLRFVLFAGAFLVAISRIFCGVHYPFDMLAGIVVGITVGLVIIILWKLVNNRFNILKEHN